MYIRRTGPCPSLLFFLSLVPATETCRHAANSIPPNQKKRTMWSQLLVSALVGALMSKYVEFQSQASREKKRISPYLNRREKKKKPQKRKKKTTTTLINLDRNHHLVLAADNSTSGPDDLAHCLCYKATSDGKIIPEDGATGSLCQQLHDGIPEQNFAGDPLYEIYVSYPGTEFEEVHVRRFSFCALLFANRFE